MDDEQSRPAAVGQVERTVRPCVWMVRRYDAPNYWIPFLHEPVDALKDPEREVVRLHWPEEIVAERERCAQALLVDFQTAKQRGLLAGDGKPCPNDHDPDCRWPDCNCRRPHD